MRVTSLHHVSPEGGTQAVRLGGTHLYLLSYRDILGGRASQLVSWEYIKANIFLSISCWIKLPILEKARFVAPSIKASHLPK